MYEKSILRFRYISVTVLFLFLSEGSNAYENETRLMNDLLRRYSKKGIDLRPVRNSTDVIKIQFGVRLMRILDFDEENDILTIKAWRNFRWQDLNCKWNPDEYDGISKIRVASNRIWTPDIVLYNSIDGRIQDDPKALISISSDGGVSWLTDSIIKSSCPIDHTNFPFDEQECLLTFGSWSYDGNQIDIDFDIYEGMGLSDYNINKKWTVIGASGKKNVLFYDCCPDEPYPNLEFNLKLERRINNFFSMIHVIHCVLLIFLSLLVYWVPAEYSARIFLSIAVFICFLTMFILFTQSLPSSATEMPPLGKFYQFNLVMITFSILVSVIVMNLYQRNVNQNKVPKWMKLIFIDALGRIMCVHNLPRHDLSNNTPNGSLPDNSLSNEVKEERSFLNAHLKEMKIKDDTEMYKREWRIVGFVFDRLFFIIHLVTIPIYASLYSTGCH